MHFILIAAGVTASLATFAMAGTLLMAVAQLAGFLAAVAGVALWLKAYGPPPANGSLKDFSDTKRAGLVVYLVGLGCLGVAFYFLAYPVIFTRRVSDLLYWRQTGAVFALSGLPIFTAGWFLTRFGKLR